MIEILPELEKYTTMFLLGWSAFILLLLQITLSDEEVERKLKRGIREK